ncbi:hypothetical protein BKE30_07820 [Alkanindiges hydrocarboniclasticus]|uniref:Uncharacterized protein n=1 Tax=Alkanindiges hydrocarboniclasticus TaxID=1907941 RepID=A0A1S8CW53_9GAMM|nr:hypothetical protein [Alkanindiges hydrocarboniclasticus]ONG40057.1 hypothetical protein BKE30_07820 [Alkanindiges hydrocarboniclasticus]
MAFNKEMASQIKTVSIVQEENQAKYPVRIMAHVGANFGLIGAAIAEADMAAKTSKLHNKIAPHQINIQEKVTQSLKTRLESNGYEVNLIKLPAKTADKQALVVASNLTTADSILVLKTQSGYVAAGSNSPYLPVITVNANLYDRKTQKLNYQETVNYGLQTAGNDAIQIDANPQYQFKNIDELMKQPQKTSAALTDGIEPITEKLASDLKR